jgi:hypothetical protein
VPVGWTPNADNYSRHSQRRQKGSTCRHQAKGRSLWLGRSGATAAYVLRIFVHAVLSTFERAPPEPGACSDKAESDGIWTCFKPSFERWWTRARIICTLLCRHSKATAGGIDRSKAEQNPLYVLHRSVSLAWLVVTRRKACWLGKGSLQHRLDRKARAEKLCLVVMVLGSEYNVTLGISGGTVFSFGGPAGCHELERLRLIGWPTS